MAAFVLQFYRSEGPFFYVGIIIWSLFLIDRLPRMFDLLFKRSYANRIPIQSILSFDHEEDRNGLEAIVRLHLSNGRYRRLRFRKLEHQLELFTEQLSQYLSVPKTA
ncbi:MAG TPA: hypothetical protein VGN63_03460 [Flavisolibacter sp.]|nr:hypothetical protein [Flavisolibacter sp.]